MMAVELIVGKGFADLGVNPLFGPDAVTLLHLGAKHVPCMKKDSSIDPNAEIVGANCPILYKGPRTLSQGCLYKDYLNYMCGMGGISNGDANQWWRLITPMFLHSGLVHMALNSLVIWRTGFGLESQMGSMRMAVFYFLCGIGGNLLSSILMTKNITVGASSAIYGLYGLLVVDLFQNWQLLKKPWRECFSLIIQVLLSLCLGLLPGIDNFAHIGGFITGVLLGAIFMPKIYYSKWDRRRKVIIALLCVPLFIAMFVYGILSFFVVGSQVKCDWCYYLDCIPQTWDLCKNERGIK
jgi:membrane associated rhomboid family serine protease